MPHKNKEYLHLKAELEMLRKENERAEKGTVNLRLNKNLKKKLKWIQHRKKN